MPRIGKRPPPYRFLLNPHDELRLSRCSKCGKQTFARQFPLLIHIDGVRELVLGKTSKYCAGCETIMCYQHELDAELFHFFSKSDPSVIGNDYLVIGTVDRKVWKAALAEAPLSGTMAEQLVEFGSYGTIDYDPGGWRPQDAPPDKWIIKGVEAAAR